VGDPKKIRALYAVPRSDDRNNAAQLLNVTRENLARLAIWHVAPLLRALKAFGMFLLLKVFANGVALPGGPLHFRRRTFDGMSADKRSRDYPSAERLANALRDYFGTSRSQLCALAPFRSQIAFGDRDDGASKALILLG
jgi:hypothetical protein